VFAFHCFCLNLQTNEFEMLCALNYKIKFPPHKFLIFISHFFFPTCLHFSFFIYFLCFLISFFFILLSLLFFSVLFLSFLFLVFLFYVLFLSFLFLVFLFSVLFLSFLFLVFLYHSAVGLHIFSKCLFHFNFSHLIGPYVDLVLTTNRFSCSAGNIVEPEFH
jgi:hypothetical protein